jgi:hypothetical protein
LDFSTVSAQSSKRHITYCLGPGVSPLSWSPYSDLEIPQTGDIRVFVVAGHVTLRLPVRSALFKQRTGGLVVKWVTISESPLLYVFVIFVVCGGGEFFTVVERD